MTGVVDFEARRRRVLDGERQAWTPKARAIATLLLALLNATGINYRDLARLMQRLHRSGGACDADIPRLEHLLLSGQDSRSPAERRAATAGAVQLRLPLHLAKASSRSQHAAHVIHEHPKGAA